MRDLMGDVVFGDKVKVEGDYGIGIMRGPPAPAASQQPSGPSNDVLMLLSNPRGTDPLRLLEEQRRVDLAILTALYRDRLRIVPSPDTHYYDLQSSLPRHRPVVVHFSGHGSGV